MDTTNRSGRQEGDNAPPSLRTSGPRLTDLLRSDYAGPSACTSLVGSGLDAVRFELRMKGKADLTVDDLEGQPFHAVHYFVHAVELEAASGGELLTHLRVVLVNADKETVSCVSGGVVDALQTLIDRMGVGPWTAPLPIVFRRVKTRKGYSMLTLAIADPPTESKSGGRTSAK